MSVFGWIIAAIVLGQHLPSLVALGISFVVVRWLWILTRSVFRI